MLTIRRFTNRHRGAAFVAAFVLVAVQKTGACSEVMTPQTAGSNFVVQLLDGEAPLRDITVLVQNAREFCSAGKREAEGISGADGRIAFKGIASGDHYLCAKNGSDLRMFAWVKVSTQEADERTIQVNLPGSSPIVVRNIGGVIRWERRLNIALLDYNTSKLLAKTETNSIGEFHEKTVPVGKYWLEISSAAKGDEQGRVLVELRPEADEKQIDLDVGFTSCGMTSLQHRHRL
jgi:hypothetical protein